MAKATAPAASALVDARLPTPDPTLSIFINCPYDSAYEPLMDAIVFTTVCCGFYPRLATESEGTDVPRMERILHAVFTSRYSIHDLTRFRGEGEDLLSRFNMPLELGLAVGRAFVSGVLSRHDCAGPLADAKYAQLLSDLVTLEREHRWLVLVPEGAEYNRFVSDLSGYDLKRYDGDVDSIIPRLLSWLLTLEGAVPGMRPNLVQKGYREFRAKMQALKIEWARQVPWLYVLEAARESVPAL